MGPFIPPSGLFVTKDCIRVALDNVRGGGGGGGGNLGKEEEEEEEDEDEDEEEEEAEEAEEAERAGSGCSMRPNMSSVGSKSSKEVAEDVPGFEKKLLSRLVLLLNGRTSEFKGCISEFERLMKRGDVTFRTPDSLIALANLDEVVEEEACWLSRLDWCSKFRC